MLSFLKQLLYILFFFVSFTSWAQNDPCIRAFNQQGQEISILCVGQQVRFEDCDGQVPDENEYYLFDYKKESPIPTPSSNSKTHTYTEPGKYRVLQIANYGGNRLTDTVSQVFEVREAPVPTFTTRTCANGLVSVTITDNNYDSYTVDFGDGQQPVNAQPNTPAQRTYSTHASYTITVTGTYTGGSCAGTGTSDVITLPPAPQPIIRNLTVLQQATNGQLQLALQGLQPGYNYIVQQRGTGGFQTIDTIRNVTQAALSHQLQNVNTSEGMEYLVKPVDDCGTTFQGSNTISSIASEAASGNEEVNLSWRSAPVNGNFEVYRDGVLLQTLNNTGSTFIDTDVSCGQTYRYEVRSVAPDGNISVAATQEVLVTSTALPPAAFLLTTFDLNNNVLVSLELPPGETVEQMEVERSTDGGEFIFIGHAQQATFTDENVTLGNICYRVTFRNACGNSSASSNVSCPIILQAQKQEDGAAVVLSWSAFEGFPSGVRQYTVELLDEDNNVVRSYTTRDTTYTDRNLHEELLRLRYRIKATSASGIAETYSNTADVQQDLLLFVPSGFTPNEDGLNDVFEIKGRFFDSYTLLVYNSLGQVVYEGTEADDRWNGTYKGEKLPPGAYAYVLTASNIYGASRRRTGTITLLR